MQRHFISGLRAIVAVASAAGLFVASLPTPGAFAQSQGPGQVTLTPNLVPFKPPPSAPTPINPNVPAPRPAQLAPVPVPTPAPASPPGYGQK